MFVKSKRNKRILIIIAVIIFAVLLLWLIIPLIYSGNVGSFNIYASTYNAEISADSVDDTQLTDNKLVKIGDKLYYNYQANIFSYGTYEISSNGAKRIYWGAGPIVQDNDKVLEPIAVYDGMLVSDSISYDFSNIYINVYNASSCGFNNSISFDRSAITYSDVRLEYIDNKNYFITSTHVYQETGGQVTDIANVYDKGEDIIADYKILNLQGDIVYYAKGVDDECVIASYNIDTNTKKKLCTFSVECERINSIFSDGKNLIVEVGWGYTDANSSESYLRLYYVDTEKNGTPQEIYKNDGSEAYGGCLMYNGVLYYNIAEADGGIYAVGLDDITQREKIYSGYVASIHILDSEWIYFTDESNALSRITHDGDIVERIFG